VVLGPLIHHALAAVSRVGKSDAVDLWSITELPFSIPQQLLHSISDHKKLVVVEEHIKAGGFGEKLLCSLQEKHVVLEDLIHLYAGGYPSGRYGSQEFHRRENDLDSLGIQKHIRRLL
jgi:transketolase